MKRSFLAVMLPAALISAALALGPAEAEESPLCGTTTLVGTIEVDIVDGRPTGKLRCGPPDDLETRELLVTAQAGRETRRSPLTAFYAMADVQLADEESPLRGEWADKCEEHPATAAFRPHETMVPHLMNAHVRAADAVAAAGSPVLGAPLDFVVGLGDLADNQQLNEVRWIIDIFDGGQLVDPDTGDDGYVGVQGTEPRGADGEKLSPTGESVLDLANEPFWATGLRAGATQIPWYSLPGNHDVKVQGTVSDDNRAWRAAVRAYALGHLKLMDLAPDYQQRVCAGDPTVFEDIIADPAQAGLPKVVQPDLGRLPLYRSDEAKGPDGESDCLAATQIAVSGGHPGCRSSWIEEHFTTTGLPVGHGYGGDDASTPAVENGRCTDETGTPLERACYSFDNGLFHYVSLDTNPAEGLESGNIDEAQFRWLEDQLAAHSTSYFDETGAAVENPEGSDKLIVVLTHHTISSTDNTGLVPGSASNVHDGEDLEELLLRFPNVILQADGHTHQNKIWPHENADLDTGYWEVNTSAIADLPHQSRTIEIADNRDGTLSIFAVVVNAAVPPDARTMDWAATDPTSETAAGAARDINEDWLASYGREVGFYDPQADLNKIGEEVDRNVELLISAPEWLQAPPPTSELAYTGETSERVGRRADVSVILTSGGSPLSEMTVTFTRGDQSASAVTGPDGVAATTLKIGGPVGTSVPLTVSFAGSGDYPAASLEVPFEALASPKGRGPSSNSRGVSLTYAVLGAL